MDTQVSFALIPNAATLRFLIEKTNSDRLDGKVPNTNLLVRFKHVKPNQNGRTDAASVSYGSGR